jgi:hypothetical protein
MSLEDFFHYGGPWFSALGSLAAVIVALSLARRRVVGKPKLRIRQTNTLPEGEIRFWVVNRGEAPVTVIDIGWRVGFPWQRKYFPRTLQGWWALAGATLPIELKTNQVATFQSYVVPDPTNPGFDSWSDFLANKFDGGSAKLWARSVRGWAETSDGRRIFARLEKSLRADLAHTARLSRKRI